MSRSEVKKWLWENGITQNAIAREAGVSPTMVTLALKGERSPKKVAEALRRVGCPEELLAGMDHAA